MTLLVLLAACSATIPDERWWSTWTMFPFDGVRTWSYVHTDPLVPYALVATSSGDPEDVGGTRVYTVEYASSPGPEVLRRVKWSSDGTRGVLVHAWDVGTGFVELSPPIGLAIPDMPPDETLETESGGATWTSTRRGTEPCPIHLDATWDECGVFELAVDTGDGWPIAGTWWATVGNGIAAMELAGESGQWQLSDLTCDGDCDGTW